MHCPSKTNGSKKVMIVDDDGYIVETMEQLLRKNGYSTVAAHDGRQCLGLLDEDGISLILLDVMLPGMNGMQVAEKIRKTNGPNPRIVFVTIKNMAEVDTSNVDGFVQKPFEIGQLLQTVERFV